MTAILNLSNIADTQESQRLALVLNLMDRSLSMPATDDCFADNFFIENPDHLNR